MSQQRVDSVTINPNDWFLFDWEHVELYRTGAFFNIIPDHGGFFTLFWEYSGGITS